MTTAMAKESDKQVARPLRILVPLIKEDLRHGNEAAQSAGMPYYKAAGEKLTEAKIQFEDEPRKEFDRWVKRNFKIQTAQAYLYMKFAKDSSPGAKFSSLDDFRRRGLGYTIVPGSQRDKDWQNPVRQIMGRVDLETLRDAELKRSEERDAERKLALQLIDIGYKTLATKLHPDKGGSRDAMARLNRVRDRLKIHV